MFSFTRNIIWLTLTLNVKREEWVQNCLLYIHTFDYAIFNKTRILKSKIHSNFIFNCQFYFYSIESSSLIFRDLESLILFCCCLLMSSPSYPVAPQVHIAMTYSSSSYALWGTLIWRSDYEGRLQRHSFSCPSSCCQVEL